jgi:hypothetical protein
VLAKRFIPSRIILIVACLSLLWPISFLILDYTNCGGLVPHHHILLGGAGDHELALHLLQERECGQHSDNETAQHPGKGEVLSVLSSDQNLAGKILSTGDGIVHLISAALPVVIASLSWLILRAALHLTAPIIAPLLPPPRRV